MVVFMTIGFWFSLSIFFSLLISHRFTSPIKRITEVVLAMKKRNFSETVGIYPKNEIGILAQTIDTLAKDLSLYINKLKQEKTYLETILKQSIFEGIMVTDEKGELILFNDAFKAFFPHVNIGQKSLEILRDKELVDGIEKIIKGEKKMSIELVFSYPREAIFDVHLYRIMSNGKTLGAIAVFYDITHLKRLERIRRDFVANVSHELRTPLTSIKGYAETLLYEENLEKIKEFSSIILKHTDFLIKLNQDLIELSIIESEGYLLKKESISLKEIIEETIETFKEIAEGKGVEIKGQIDEKEVIWGNKERIKQVFNNLIDNAIKYTEKGQIKVNTEGSGQFVIIKVSDTGIGIPKMALTRIFERFYRVDKGRSNVLGSTGLGLSIVKHIVERNGGQIWVESELGKGSTFFIKWPKYI
jgi:two-component system phosphate regulon sensor histidine kinase PhoR